MKTEVLLEYAKILIVADLKNNDHIGFLTDNNDRGYIAQIGGGKFLGICSSDACTIRYPNVSFGDPQFDIKSVISHINDTCSSNVIKLYKFDTRKELYKWLAED